MEMAKKLFLAPFREHAEIIYKKNDVNLKDESISSLKWQKYFSSTHIIGYCISSIKRHKFVCSQITMNMKINLPVK